MIKRLISVEKRKEIKKFEELKEELIIKLEKLGLTKDEISLLIRKEKG